MHLQPIGQAAPTLQVRLDSLSNSPDVGRATNVGCADASLCSYTPAADFGGIVTRTVAHGAASDRIAFIVRSPSSVTLTVDDSTLSAVGCEDSDVYQSTQLHLSVDGLDMTALSTYSSGAESVATVSGSRVLGASPGAATIRAHGGVATVDVTVEAAVVRPELVARVVTSLQSASSRGQSFTSEASVGYLYTHVRYAATGDVHVVDDSLLSVAVLDEGRVSYELSGGRHRIGVAQNALAASCTEELLRVSLLGCGGAVATAVPVVQLQLPGPSGVRPLVLSTSHVAADDSFARSAALSSRPARQGTVTQAAVQMDDGTQVDLSGDARVTLSSSEDECIGVADDLTASTHFWAVDSAACTSATITATFALGSWSRTATATVYVVRAQSMSVSASLYPSCSSSASTLYTLGCSTTSGLILSLIHI